MDVYAERVKRGVALLDREVPGWRARVGIDALDMRSGCRCILGQLFEYYEVGIRSLWGGSLASFVDFWEEGSVAFSRALEHGFTVDGDLEEEWDLLEDAWIEELWLRG